MHQLRVPRHSTTESKKTLNNISITSHSLLASLLFPVMLCKQQQQKELYSKGYRKIFSRWYSATCASLSHLRHHWERGRELNNSSETGQQQQQGRASGLNTGAQRLTLLCIKSLYCSGCASNPSLTTLSACSSNDPGAVQNGISTNEN